ncbi:MAG: YkgJ family cysteine cluster protein [Methanotrichaceae archaeon]|nr:YkgJ family cysteine cluster protein [Methanotrichaceae archaeon]
MTDINFLADKKSHLIDLFQELETAKEISVKELAAQIRQIGFQCMRCGDCCIGEDNSVIVFPSEIRLISRSTGDFWLEIVEPPKLGEWDLDGNFHTLEWRLKKRHLSCKYYTLHGCMIYEERPLLCRTYPFFLTHIKGLLCFSECNGFGKEIRNEESEELADLLVERLIQEIKESIALIEKFDGFERGTPSKEGLCVVHDSEGEHRFNRDI